MADPKSRARVERILSGEFRPDDLTGLFLFARDHCDGRESVMDIGDFIAHHSERDRGIVTRSTREWFAVARFHVPLAVSTNKMLDPKKMPPATSDYFAISVNRIDAKIIREKASLSRPNAYKLMQGIVERLKQNPDGTWSLPDRITPPEDKLLRCICSTMVVKPAFSADHLCDDFIATLKSNGLITKDEISKHGDDLRVTIQLYAIAAMHNCVVQIGDGTTTQLKAAPVGKSISVSARVPNLYSAYNAPVTYIAAAMFTAELDPDVHCHPDLRVTGTPPHAKNQEWNFEIELAPNKLLSRLG